MLIWLGKQLLDQRDVQYLTTSDLQELLREQRTRMSELAERVTASNPEHAELIDSIVDQLAEIIGGG